MRNRYHADIELEEALPVLPGFTVTVASRANCFTGLNRPGCRHSGIFTPGRFCPSMLTLMLSFTGHDHAAWGNDTRSFLG